jgi:hypothetical protein
MPRSKPYRLHPLAWLEIEGGEDWYRQRSSDTGADFASDIGDAIKSIRLAPNAGPNTSTEPGASSLTDFHSQLFISMLRN